ncbi:MAG: c-type cytochrome, partial [Gammaproteobacteria bacterium]
AAGNYDAMCAGCHLTPGVEESELSAGLNPAPPSLARHPIDDPAQAFWTIKHGVKMTGMPAWGRHMEDPHIWGLVAFLRQLPSMTPESYRALVAVSGGHAHGPQEGPAAGAPEDEDETHAHEDGSRHQH